MSPTWYKSNEYRARAVRDPRGVLRDFGVDIGDDVEVRVWDSTSERRYLVVPQRPAGTEAVPAGRAELTPGLRGAALHEFIVSLLLLR
jgi:nitrile hydratase